MSARSENDERSRLMASIRARFPGIREAVLADARITARHRGERHAFTSGADAVVQILKLMWVSDAFLALVLYRVKARLQARGIPVLPRLAHRAAMIIAQVSIGDPVILQPGVYVIHGQVVLDGLVEVGSGTIIGPWVTLGLRAGNIQGPRVGRNVSIGTGAKLIGPIEVGDGATIGANAVVVDDVPAGVTVVGAPARALAAKPREPAPEPLEHPMAQFFAPMRAARAEHYAGYRRGHGNGKRRALLTMTHNEAVFLPIWLRYYSRFFKSEDIYVFDDASTDGSTDNGGFVRIPADHDRVDDAWRIEMLRAKQNELLESYDVVLIADVDEIVAPTPSWGTLGDYIDRFDESSVNCLGYEVLHLPDREPALNPDRPLLEQRHYWYANDGYNKALLATEPIPGRPGFHGPDVTEWNLDPDLRLIHLHRIDREICRERHAHWRDRPWDERDLESSWAFHNRLTAGEEFDRWFFHDSSCAGVEIRPEPIPDEWRELL